MPQNAPLQSAPVNIRIKLAGLWCSLLFCYIYCDYFELYQPGKLQAMLAGTMAVGHVSQNLLTGMAALMIAPSLTICLTLMLPCAAARWLNIALGLLYTVVMVLAIQGAWRFYILFGLIEITLSLLIVWYAWKWPRSGADGAPS